MLAGCAPTRPWQGRCGWANEHAAERFSGGFGCVDRGVLLPTATRCGSGRAACRLDLLRRSVVVASSWPLPPCDEQRLVDPGIDVETIFEYAELLASEPAVSHMTWRKMITELNGEDHS